MIAEKLEKLAELKNKGVITEKEFNEEKQNLLMLYSKEEASRKNTGFSWKNFGISFLIALLYTIIYVNTIETASIVTLILFISVTSFFVYYGKKVEFTKYKNGVKPIWIVLGMFLLNGIAVWMLSYQFLKIQDGNAELKESE